MSVNNKRRVCKICDEVKPLCEFQANTKTYKGKKYQRHTCIKCYGEKRKAYQAEYYKKKKEKAKLTVVLD